MAPEITHANNSHPDGSDALDLLSRVSATVSSASTDALDSAFNQALGDIGRFAGVERSCIIVFSRDKQTFSMTHEWCAEGIHSQLEYFTKLPMTVFPWTARQLLAGQYVATNRLDDYPPEAEQERQICLDEGNQSIIFVPFLSKGEVIGTIACDAIHAPKIWTRTLISIFQAAGALFATCLEQSRTEAQLLHISKLERQKLGQDLHDSLGQDITAISYCAAALRNALKAQRSPLAKQAEDIEKQAIEALGSVRNVTRGLQSFNMRGAPVTEILVQMAADIQERMGVVCTFVDSDAPAIEDPETCTQLLWIVREAMHNAIRHGKAKQITIALEPQGDKLSLTVIDNGIGLPDNFLNKEGIGLKVMRFRAAAMGGQVTISPHEESGARIRCVFPNGYAPACAYHVGQPHP